MDGNLLQTNSIKTQFGPSTYLLWYACKVAASLNPMTTALSHLAGLQQLWAGGVNDSPTTISVRKLVPGLSRVVVCVILRLAVLVQYWRVTDGQTAVHTISANTHASIVLRG